MIGVNVLAQDIKKTSDLFRMPINRSQGYLILGHNSNVVQWSLEISSVQYDSKGNLTLTPLKEINLLGQDYWKIDTSYINNPDVALQITGLDANGNVVVSDGPVSICNGCQGGFTHDYSWKCVSDDYAYSIDKYHKNNNNQSFMRMEFQAYNYYDNVQQISVPYYEYFSSMDYHDLVNNNPQQANNFGVYHNLDQITGIGYLFMPSQIAFYHKDPTKVIQLNNVSQQDLIRDINGNLLSGTVYGVQKAKGPWAGQFAETTPVNNSSSWYSSGLGFAINYINTNNYVNPALSPALNCSGTGIEPVDIEPAGLSCEYLESLGWTNNTIDQLLLFLGCKDAEKPLDALVQFDITNLSKDSAEVIIHRSDFIDAEGNPSPVTVSLQKGLYLMNVAYVGGDISQHIVEVVKPVTSTMAYSNYLGVTIYPNPIPENSFKMQLTPTANLKVKYELYDNQGTLRYQTTYYLNKDVVSTPTVNLRGTIPAGIMINRFIFEDGSVKTIQTIKQ